MKIIDKIVTSITLPQQTNVLWHNPETGELKMFGNNGWEVVGRGTLPEIVESGWVLDRETLSIAIKVVEEKPNTCSYQSRGAYAWVFDGDHGLVTGEIYELNEVNTDNKVSVVCLGNPGGPWSNNSKACAFEGDLDTSKVYSYGTYLTGITNTASGIGSVASGCDTIANGLYSHAEGFETIASGVASHSEGAKYENNRSTESAGLASHAEGASTYAKADGSHAEGILNVAGRFLNEISTAAQELGISGTPEELGAKLLGYGAHVEGMNNKALGSCSHAEGQATNALANSTHAEGNSTLAFGEASHAEGYNTQAKGNQSHAEGSSTVATGNSAHAEGVSTVATGSFSHAEGSHTEATGRDSHAEGVYNKAIGIASHAEGDHTIAEGEASHAEGCSTKAINNYSHAEGFATIASSMHQHVQGKYNIDDPNDVYQFIIGNGLSYNSLSNAFAVKWDGTIVLWKDVNTPLELTPDKLEKLLALVD